MIFPSSTGFTAVENSKENILKTFSNLNLTSGIFLRRERAKISNCLSFGIRYPRHKHNLISFFQNEKISIICSKYSPVRVKIFQFP